MLSAVSFARDTRGLVTMNAGRNIVPFASRTFIWLLSPHSAPTLVTRHNIEHRRVISSPRSFYLGPLTRPLVYLAGDKGSMATRLSESVARCSARVADCAL